MIINHPKAALSLKGTCNYSGSKLMADDYYLNVGYHLSLSAASGTLGEIFRVNTQMHCFSKKDVCKIQSPTSNGSGLLLAHGLSAIDGSRTSGEIFRVKTLVPQNMHSLKRCMQRYSYSESKLNRLAVGYHLAVAHQVSFF
jgi:hypothetical protein